MGDILRILMPATYWLLTAIWLAILVFCIQRLIAPRGKSRLFATVMHTLNMARDGSAVFGEVRRVLKPAGRLAIINCKKEDQPFGPPIEKRFSPQETEKLVVPCGFRTLEQVDLGYNYLIQFRIDESRQNH